MILYLVILYLKTSRLVTTPAIVITLPSNFISKILYLVTSYLVTTLAIVIALPSKSIPSNSIDYYNFIPSDYIISITKII